MDGKHGCYFAQRKLKTAARPGRRNRVKKPHNMRDTKGGWKYISKGIGKQGELSLKNAQSKEEKKDRHNA